MYVSERQAQLHLCHRFLGLEGVANPAAEFNCKGHYCMAWQPKKGLTKEDLLDPTGKKSIGYCGLAGAPQSELVYPNSPGR